MKASTTPAVTLIPSGYKADIPSANIFPFTISGTNGFDPVKHSLTKYTL